MIIYVVLNNLIDFASLFVSFYSIAIGNFDIATWFLPFDFTVPFDTENLLGWYLLWTYNVLCNMAYTTCLSSTSSYFVCCCLYLGGLCDHFDLFIQEVHHEVQRNRHEINPQKIQESNQIVVNYLRKAIDIQNQTFEYVLNIKCAQCAFFESVFSL